MQPDWPLTKLTQAEYALKNGKPLEGRQILVELTKGEQIPAWVKDRASVLINTKP